MRSTGSLSGRLVVDDRSDGVVGGDTCRPSPVAGRSLRVAASAGAGDEQLAKSVAKLCAEQTVDDGVDGAAGQAEPLDDWNGGLSQLGEFGVVHVGWRAEVDADVDGVQRQPAERKDHHHDDQHLHYTYLGSIDDLFIYTVSR